MKRLKVILDTVQNHYWICAGGSVQKRRLRIGTAARDSTRRTGSKYPAIIIRLKTCRARPVHQVEPDHVELLHTFGIMVSKFKSSSHH
jgi:hypothetical protein